MAYAGLSRDQPSPEEQHCGFAVDFRSLYATALERWWGVPAAPVLNSRYPALELLRS